MTAKPLSAPERHRLRQDKSVPRLQQFKTWLESQQAHRGGAVLPKSPMGQAIGAEPGQPQVRVDPRAAP